MSFVLLVLQAIRSGKAAGVAESQRIKMQRKVETAVSEAQGARAEVVKERAEATQARKDQRDAVAALSALMNQRARETKPSVQGTVGGSRATPTPRLERSFSRRAP